MLDVFSHLISFHLINNLGSWDPLRPPKYISVSSCHKVISNSSQLGGIFGVAEQ